MLSPFHVMAVNSASMHRYSHLPSPANSVLRTAGCSSACPKSRPCVPRAHADHPQESTVSCPSTSYPTIQERGVQITPGDAFYRGESAQGRDLAVLAAAVYKRQHGVLRVLDVMSGSGVRGARYLQQADADMVWCNDYNPDNHSVLMYNLLTALTAQGAAAGCSQAACAEGHHVDIAPHVQRWSAAAHRWRPGGIRTDVLEWSDTQVGNHDQSRTTHAPAGKRCRVSQLEANRLLSACYLNEDYYDLVDVDSFGSDTMHLPAAIDAVKFGGLLYLTSTDGFSSSGKRPERALAAYGSYLRALPCANEQGLRMLIGAAVKEAAARGVVLEPLFSLYSFHGPVFRVMLRVKRSKEWPVQHYNYLGHCFKHGETRRVHWRGLSQAWCRCCPENVCADSKPTPLVLSGPMWTGPLHNRPFIEHMQQEAALRSWTGSVVCHDSPYVVKHSKNNRYVCVSCPGVGEDNKSTSSPDDMGLNPHCHVKALRTNATMQQVLDIAVHDCQYRRRAPQEGLVPDVLLQQHEQQQVVNG
eukprot:jgi/Chrzof1/587/Cz01g21110.t1